MDHNVISQLTLRYLVISGVLLIQGMTSVERHKGTTASHLHRKLDPFASKLTVYITTQDKMTLVKRQNDLTASHSYTKLDPFVS